MKFNMKNTMHVLISIGCDKVYQWTKCECVKNRYPCEFLFVKTIDEMSKFIETCEKETSTLRKPFSFIICTQKGSKSLLGAFYFKKKIGAC